MINKCEHCGQTVMATDSQCWHCGKPLSPSKPKAVQLPRLATAVPDDDPNPPMPPFRTILLYAGLTAVALLILITTTRAIGQAPLFLFSGGSTPLDGWQSVTNDQRAFTLDLPDSWQTVELTQDSEANALLGSPPLQAVRSTFDALVADSELLFLGTEDTAVFANGNPVFVLVAQSQRLQQLSPEDIVSYAEQQLPANVTIVEASTTESLANEPKGNLLINIEQDEQTWRCQEQFVPAESSTFLIATCTTFTQFPAHIADFSMILLKFQPLRS